MTEPRIAAAAAGARRPDGADPALDTSLRISLAGFAPHAEVTVHSGQADPFGRLWGARAAFRCDERGSVDLSAAAPLSGSYSGVDPMGLVWSMRVTGGGRRAPADRRVLPPSTLTLTAHVEGRPVAEATVDRRRLPAGVRRTVVRARGLVGTLFRPVEGGPSPGVLLIGGSEGGLHELDAALLAAHGFTVLALAYFGVRGVPSDLMSIPLEYFGTAITFLRERPPVRPGPLAVLGGSRGGEAALLIGARFAEIGAVVSVVGSGVLTEAIAPGHHVLEKIGQPCPSWTLRGAPLPYLRCVVSQEVVRRARSREPFELAAAFRPALDDPAAVEAATIPVERIRGGVLLISAGDDRMWPSGPLSEIAAHRLDKAGRPVEHVHYPEAGHLIAAPPFGPSTEIVVPGPGVRFATGGTPAANAAARADAWCRAVRFLREQLSGGSRPG